VSYQVLARKWRPQRFDDVIGQQAVTRTLRNAIDSQRVAHAFVFAGSRGCGKTTTARILARALNCMKGPTADPCGECEACVEIAQGRDIDVLEIDAASHTGIDNIREVVLAGLAIAPVRNRYKVFIIDEVHQLSSASFNALLKSIEEPPPHVVFMMATTELHKIPDTILSRSQVYEFRTIPANAIVKQLKMIAKAEGITVSDAALALVARSAEGSMRDAQSAFDQVISFAGSTITDEDVSTVLGLVGRDLLFDMVEAVCEEDAPRAFAAVDRAVESGHDLRLVVRELTSVVRDMMIVSVDPSRANDAEIAEGERARLVAIAGRFSREDLLRAFDVLAAADTEIKTAAQPRFHLEMALLRWMHLRKLVPLTELLSAGSTGSIGSSGSIGSGSRGSSGSIGSGSKGSAGSIGSLRAPAAPAARVAPPATPRAVAGPLAKTPPPREPIARAVHEPIEPLAPVEREPLAPHEPVEPLEPKSRATSGQLKDALLAEIRSGKGLLYNTVVAQAQKIEVAGDTVTFTFLPTHRALREQFDQARPWLEAAAERIAGRRVAVVSAQAAASEMPQAGAPAPEKESPPAGKRDLKAEAMSSSSVQAMLDVFPAEIRDVEEM
jgi:DNA polymerase III subunit gamma/tau